MASAASGPAPGSPGPPRHGLRRPTEESTAAGIYGIVVGAAVMAASHEDRAAAVTRTVVVTLLIYWAAERYSRVVAQRIHEGHRLTRHQVRLQLSSGWEIVTASALPPAVLVTLDLVGVALDTAVFWALACSTLLLCLAGWEIGWAGHLTTRERLGAAALAGVFGVVLILLKAVLH